MGSQMAENGLIRQLVWHSQYYCLWQFTHKIISKKGVMGVVDVVSIVPDHIVGISPPFGYVRFSANKWFAVCSS